MKYGQTFREAYRQVRLKKEDNEVSMAVGQLKTMQDNLNQLMSILQSKTIQINNQVNLELNH